MNDFYSAQPTFLRIYNSFSTNVLLPKPRHHSTFLLKLSWLSSSDILRNIFFMCVPFFSSSVLFAVISLFIHVINRSLQMWKKVRKRVTEERDTGWTRISRLWLHLLTGRGPGPGRKFGHHFENRPPRFGVCPPIGQTI